MKTALGLLAALSLASLSACSSGPRGEHCLDSEGITWDGPTVTCGGAAFEKLNDVIAWRDIVDSGSCPGTRCDDIEIVTSQWCDQLDIGSLRLKGGDPSDRSGTLLDVSPDVKYTLQMVDMIQPAWAEAKKIQCILND